MEWQPIESAPKDGTYVDLWCIAQSTFDGKEYQYRVTDARFDVPEECYFPGDQIAQWISEDFVCDGLGEAPIRAFATHWMPLPEPPKD